MYAIFITISDLMTPCHKIHIASQITGNSIACYTTHITDLSVGTPNSLSKGQFGGMRFRVVTSKWEWFLTGMTLQNENEEHMQRLHILLIYVLFMSAKHTVMDVNTSWSNGGSEYWRCWEAVLLWCKSRETIWISIWMTQGDIRFS